MNDIEPIDKSEVFSLFGRTIRISSSSIRGRREENQDCLSWFAVTNEGNHGDIPKDIRGQEMLFCVLCDGMGGMRDGSAASRMVVRSLIEWARIFTGSSDDLCWNIRSILSDTERRMVHLHPGSGTTFIVLAYIYGELITVHLGDSRCYLISGERIERTFDHSPVDNMVEHDLITEEEASSHPMRNMISGYVGAEDSRLPKMTVGRYDIPDIAILCSDGAYGCMKERSFIDIVRNNSAESIVKECFDAGSGDNISVIKVSFRELSSDHI